MGIKGADAEERPKARAAAIRVGLIVIKLLVLQG
jgi:hypothetical protein